MLIDYARRHNNESTSAGLQSFLIATRSHSLLHQPQNHLKTGPADLCSVRDGLWSQVGARFKVQPMGLRTVPVLTSQANLPFAGLVFLQINIRPQCSGPLENPASLGCDNAIVPGLMQDQLSR
jgi:hypothetical protein